MAERKRQKSSMYCCVPHCKTYFDKNAPKNVPFHTFPKTDKVLRAKWIHKLKISKQVSPFMRVCGKHFRDEDYFFNKRVPCKVHRLKKNSIPSVNLPIGTHEFKNTDAPIQARSIRQENIREKLKITNNVAQTVDEQNEATALTILSCQNVHSSCVEENIAETLLSFSKEEVIISREKTFVDIGIQVNTYEEFNKFDVSDIIDTDKKVRILTGIQNLALLNVLVQFLSKLDHSRSKFDCRKVIILTLMRIKLDLPFSALSALFNVSHTSAQTYFQRTVKHLAHILRPSIRFPSKEEICKNMPQCFDKFPNTRIVLDCTEVELQKSNRLKGRIRTYSFYKSKHTIKFLIGVAPSSGLITFVSRAYGGRASNKAIFNKENLISKLSSGDAIMVDKGFLIDQECAEHNVILIRPPFLKKKRQLEKSDACKTAEIARARVHIERVIQRMKLFRMFRNVLPFKILSQINNIVTIIVALTNLSKPVLSKGKLL